MATLKKNAARTKKKTPAKRSTVAAPRLSKLQPFKRKATAKKAPATKKAPASKKSASKRGTPAKKAPAPAKKRTAKKAAPRKKTPAKKKTGRKVGRPRFNPTEFQRREVETMAGVVGMTNEEIATVLEIDRETVAKYFARELKLGKIKRNQNIAAILHKQAMGTMPPIVHTFYDPKGQVIGSKTVTQKAVPAVGVFIARTQLGWTEEAAGAGGNTRPSGVLAIPTIADSEWKATAEKQQRDLIATISRKRSE